MEVRLTIGTGINDLTPMDVTNVEGTVTDSQLFAFGGVEGPTALVPKNGNNAVCLVGESGRLEAVSCVASQPSENEVCCASRNTTFIKWSLQY
jgi:hypothetical protein